MRQKKLSRYLEVRKILENNKLMIIVFLLAFFLRANWMGNHFGQDEVYYVGYTKDLVNGKPFSNVFPPFIEILLSPLVLVFGDNPTVIHTFIAFLGALTVALVFYIGKKFFNPNIGFVAAVFLMFNTTHWFFSDFAMLDVPAALFSLIAFFYYWSGYKRKNYNHLFIAMLFSSIAVLTRYLFFSSAAMLAYLVLFDRKSLKNRYLMVTILVPFFVFGLWMAYYITQLQWLWGWWSSYVTGQLSINVPAYFYLESVYFEYLLPPLTFFVLFASLFLLSKKYKIFKEKYSQHIFLILFLVFLFYFEFMFGMNPTQRSIVGASALLVMFLNYGFKSSDFNRYLILLTIITYAFFSFLGVKFPRYLLSILPAIYLLVGQAVFDLRKNRLLFVVSIILIAYFIWFNSFDTVNKLLTDKAINEVKFQAQDYVSQRLDECGRVYSKTWYGFYYVRDKVGDLPSADSLKNTVKENCNCLPMLLVEGSLPDEYEEIAEKEKEFRISAVNYRLDLDGFREEVNVISPVYVYKIRDDIVKEVCPL